MKLRVALSTVLFAGLLSACGPKMQTDYHLTPPEDKGGVACTFHCESEKRDVEQDDDSEYQRCRDDAEEAFEICQEDNEYRRKDDREICIRRYCPKPKEQHCLSAFHRCYEECGGRVDSETYCVANCDQ